MRPTNELSLSRLSAEYKKFWAWVGTEIVEIFEEIVKSFPASPVFTRAIVILLFKKGRRNAKYAQYQV